MIKKVNIRVKPQQANSVQQLKRIIAQKNGWTINDINAIRIRKKSIDARQLTVFIQLTVEVFLNEEPENNLFEKIEYPIVDNNPQAIIVGAGPGGLFAALRLIELGIKPIVVERGKDVRTRKRDIAEISRSHIVDPESNYSFGEGGAGAYSDGKLYTRSKKRGNVEKILRVFCQHGADTTIMIDAHPHIGTDKLPRVIETMRNQIISAGGEVYFETKMTDFIINKEKVSGIITQNGKEFIGPVILATGHSARDVYEWLYKKQITIEAKGIAVGVRLEHPAHLIDQLQYHSKEGRGAYLPAAEYNYVAQVKERGVYSFCMCPGGFVVPAATGPEQVVVNGMSPSNRGSKWSNSGMVVEIRPEDLMLENLGNKDIQESPEVLQVLKFQEYLEHICWLNGGCSQIAPAQRMSDFTQRKLSSELPKSSYSAGLVASPLHFWMPNFITERLQKGFEIFGKRSKGFLTNEAIMIGVETRTSAPIRILRDRSTLEHISMKGLFPCGEGAGYAGGIVSAAIDGERCAESLAKIYFNKGN